MVNDDFEVYYSFNAGNNGGTMAKDGCGIAEGCFTDVVVHSLMSYHKERALPRATEARRLHTDVDAARGAVMLRFHGVNNPEIICL